MEIKMNIDLDINNQIRAEKANDISKLVKSPILCNYKRNAKTNTGDGVMAIKTMGGGNAYENSDLSTLQAMLDPNQKNNFKMLVSS
jgi:hypothetical protein